MSSSFTCSFSIADLGVSLVCDDERFAAAPRERYHAFPLYHPPVLTLHVVLADTHDHPGAAELLMDAWTVQQSTSVGQNIINVKTGDGWLVVPKLHALESVEYWLRVAYALLVFRAGGLLFHAAGIVRGGQAFLFCGRSGSGKTTVARLSPHDLVLNDDLVVLMPHGGSWTVYATPFSNSTQVRPAGATSAPLVAVFRLVQSKTVGVEPIKHALALAEVLTNVPVVAANPAMSDAMFKRCQHLLAAVPVRYLHFLPDPSFWPVVEMCVS